MTRDEKMDKVLLYNISASIYMAGIWEFTKKLCQISCMFQSFHNKIRKTYVEIEIYIHNMYIYMCVNTCIYVYSVYI